MCAIMLRLASERRRRSRRPAGAESQSEPPRTAAMDLLLRRVFMHQRHASPGPCPLAAHRAVTNQEPARPSPGACRTVAEGIGPLCGRLPLAPVVVLRLSAARELLSRLRASGRSAMHPGEPQAGASKMPLSPRRLRNDAFQLRCVPSGEGRDFGVLGEVLACREHDLGRLYG